MTFDLDAWLKKVQKSVGKRRIPQIETSSLFVLDLASALLGYEPGRADVDRVKAVADKLEWVAGRYEHMAVSQAMRSFKGRPPEWADVAFIDGMASVLTECGVKFGWRRWNATGGERRGMRGGTEEPTAFQEICNVWLKKIDPDRAKELSPHAFRMAKTRFERRNKNHSS